MASGTTSKTLNASVSPALAKVLVKRCGARPADLKLIFAGHLTGFPRLFD